MSTANWTLEYSGTKKSFADWGLTDLDLEYEQWGDDAVSFRAAGMNIDLQPLFPYRSTVIIRDPSDKIWLVGLVTKVPKKCSGKAEDQFYNLEGPWWYFKNLVFQETWVSINPDGSGNLVSTLDARTIIGDGGGGTKIDLGQMATLVFQYVLAVAAASKPPFVPFQLGKMTPDTIIPFSEVENLTCAELLTNMFSWVPDAMLQFDYSTLLNGQPCPTLNVVRRGDAGVAALTLGRSPLGKVEITPRDDLVVPSVVVKYKQTNNVDGESLISIVPDKYPPDAQDPAFGALVQSVELIGGTETYQKQALVTTDRPKDYNGATSAGAGPSVVTLAWLSGEHRYKNLRQYTIHAGANPNSISYVSIGNADDNDIVVQVDQTKIKILSVVTRLASNYTMIDPATGEQVPQPVDIVEWYRHSPFYRDSRVHHQLPSGFLLRRGAIVLCRDRQHWNTKVHPHGG